LPRATLADALAPRRIYLSLAGPKSHRLAPRSDDNVQLSFHSIETWHKTTRRQMEFLATVKSIIIIIIIIISYTKYDFVSQVIIIMFVMVALRNRADHYIFAPWFLSSFSFLCFPRLISAVADWTSAIIPHVAWP